MPPASCSLPSSPSSLEPASPDPQSGGWQANTLRPGGRANAGSGTLDIVVQEQQELAIAAQPVPRHCAGTHGTRGSPHCAADGCLVRAPAPLPPTREMHRRQREFRSVSWREKMRLNRGQAAQREVQLFVGWNNHRNDRHVARCTRQNAFGCDVPTVAGLALTGVFCSLLAIRNRLLTDRSCVR